MPLTLAAVTVTSAGACVMTESTRRWKGEDLLRDASNAIANAKTLRFVVDETNEHVTRRGARRVVHLERHVSVRRPNRLWFKTSGDRDVEGVYDGTNLTLLFHADKVYGVMPTSVTLDDAVDAIPERYDLPFPIGDLVNSSANGSLIDTKTTGGWRGREDIAGVPSERLDWHHPDVDWSIWIATTGTPLPTKLIVNDRTRRRTMTALFNGWDLSSPLPEDTFESHVPADYEGIAVVQREAAAAEGEEAAVALGTVLARPPAAAATVIVGGTSYWYHDNVFYTRVVTGGSVAYQVVGPPAGAIIATLPAGCSAARVGAITYQRCGGVYYERVATGYRIVAL
jgi:hypothetical protein